jgi:hypothetical protein
VPLNTWWTSDPAQRYWMEITDRADTGTNLQAPKLDVGEWSYDLVSQVQPGDRVLHWDTRSARALVGWSEVIGPVTTVPEYTWQPHGTVGRRLPAPRTTEGWVAPLGGMKRFPTPVAQPTLRALLDELMTLRSTLQAKHGKTTYFPFTRYAGTQLRAQQAYLVKFPVELFDLIPGISSARLNAQFEPDDADISEDFQPTHKRAPHGRTTRVQDPKLRAAIERRALDVALAYYEEIGATDARELGKPYDLAVTVDGVERHCEVKGSSMLIDTVELTINEVTHGRDCAHVDLIVVDGIKVARDKVTGEIYASGGSVRVWTDWTPAEDALQARKFAYLLPSSEA